MNKELLKFFTYFTCIERLRSCVKDKTRRTLLGIRYPWNANDYTVVGNLYISEHNAYIVLSSWHVKNFESLVKPYVYCTKLLTYPRAGMEDEINTIYHITGVRNKDYVSDFR